MLKTVFRTASVAVDYVLTLFQSNKAMLICSVLSVSVCLFAALPTGVINMFIMSSQDS